MKKKIIFIAAIVFVVLGSAILIGKQSNIVLDGYGEVVEPSNTINYLLLKKYGYSEDLFRKYYFTGRAIGDSPNDLIQESNYNNAKYTEPLIFDLAMVKDGLYEEEYIIKSELENFAKLLRTEKNSSEIYEVLNGFSIINGNYEDYINNARAKKIQVTINDEVIKTFELKDIEDVQLFDLNYKQIDISKPINVKIEVLEIYEGKVSNDVYITDIGFGIESFGFGGR